MKTRRGISSDIIQSDGFVAMPASAQALYMHLILTCDDGGFTSKMSICKSMAHASDDDEKLLLARGFIIQFRDEYKVVTVIKHWWANNYLRSERVVKSEFAQRSLVYKKSNGTYTTDPEQGVPLLGEKENDTQVSPSCHPTDTPTIQNNTIQDKTDISDIRTKNEGSDIEKVIVPSTYTKKLVECGYISANSPYIEDYNNLLHTLSVNHSSKVLNSVLWYFIAHNRDGKDANGEEIADKFAYFSKAIFDGINKVNRLNDPSAIEQEAAEALGGLDPNALF